MTDPSKHPLRDFRPALWALGPNRQTLFARILRPADGPPVEPERVATPDDDFLDLEWAPDPGPEAPIVLVMHGLEGSTRRRYMRNAFRQLLLAGVRPVGMNFRGCSGEPNRAPHFYHSGKTDDPVLVLRLIRERYPKRRLGALGFSLGGNVLLKLMGERSDGGAELVDAAAVISVPYDLAAGCDLLERTRMGKVYSAYFMRSLQSKLTTKPRLGAVIDLESALSATTIRQFDDRVTARLNGFRDAAAYYEESSSIRYLSGIRVPTLMLHARDDPFLPPDSIPFGEAGRSPSIRLVVHRRGGHVGFLGGSPWRPSFWAEEEVARFLGSRLGALNGRRPGHAVEPALEEGTDVP